MKKLILVLAILIVHCTLKIDDCSCQWFWQNPLPQGNDLSCVRFVNTSTGWVVGDYGTILKTTNGGINWNIQTNISQNYLFSVNFIDAQTGWAAGAYGIILKTTNGGINWNTLSSPVTSNLLSIQFIDSQTGWAVGYNGVIIKTTNGGTNWTFETSSITIRIQSVFFINSQTGWIGGNSGEISKTTNGGTNWFSETSGTTYTVNSIYFIDAQTGWFASYSHPGGQNVSKTTNGGINWVEQSTGSGSSLSSIYFSDSQNGWICGATNFRTTNGGANWISESFSDNIKSIYFTDSQNGWCAGFSGVIFKTTNGGINWISQNAGFNIDELLSVQFKNSQTGWTVGYPGIILKTTNGGTNWFQQTSGVTSNLASIFFVDLSTGWVLEDNGMLKTTNGGTNWFEQSTGFGNSTDALYFVDSQTGWVGTTGVSGSYRIFKTTNGGNNWVSQVSAAIYFQSVFFLNSQTGWVAGDHNILNTTNGGTDWIYQFTSATSLFNSIFFVNSQTGWVTGLTGEIYKTTNGGYNWDLQATLDILNSVYFVNSQTGWVSGGAILKTTNGGTNWCYEIGTTHGISDICFSDSQNGWAVGTGGTILKTTNGGGQSNFTISGTVRYADNNQPITNGVVKAFKLNPVDASIIILDTALIQSNGTYTLPNVPQDSLDIGVYPSSGQQVDYVITYYPSTIDWQSATVLYPTGNLSNINISAFRMTNTTASNSVSGKVTRLTDIVTGNLKDAALYAKNGNTYVRCVVSDINGVYHLQSLPSGNLKIIVNRLGFTGDSTNVNVTSTSNIDSINFHLYRFTVGIKQIGIEVPNEFKLYQNYPNPFNPVTKIKFEIPSNGFPIGAFGNDRVVLKIYDILGREIQTLVNESLQPGSYEVTFDGSSLSSGIYFYQLKAGDYIETKKMLMIK